MSSSLLEIQNVRYQSSFYSIFHAWHSANADNSYRVLVNLFHRWKETRSRCSSLHISLTWLIIEIFTSLYLHRRATCDVSKIFTIKALTWRQLSDVICVDCLISSFLSRRSRRRIAGFRRTATTISETIYYLLRRRGLLSLRELLLVKRLRRDIDRETISRETINREEITAREETFTLEKTAISRETIYFYI